MILRPLGASQIDRASYPKAPQGYCVHCMMRTQAPQGYCVDCMMRTQAPQGYCVHCMMRTQAPHGYCVHCMMRTQAPQGLVGSATNRQMPWRCFLSLLALGLLPVASETDDVTSWIESDVTWLGILLVLLQGHSVCAPYAAELDIGSATNKLKWNIQVRTIKGKSIINFY